MNQRLRSVLSFAASFIIMGGLVAYIWTQRAHVARVFEFDATLAGVVLLGTLGVYLARAEANRLLFRCFGVVVGYLNWVGVVLLSSLVNYLPMSVGLLAKGYYLRRIHFMPYRQFAVVQLLLFLLFVVCNGVIGFLVTWTVDVDARMRALVAVFFALMIASVSIIFIPAGLIPERLRSVTRLGVEPRAQLRRRLPGLFFWQAAIVLIVALNLRLCFAMIGVEATFQHCLIFSAGSIMTRLVSLTPGSLGIREFLIGAIAAMTGFEFKDAVLAASIERVFHMLITFGSGIFLGGPFLFSLVNPGRHRPKAPLK